MTVGGAEADVRIRTPLLYWMGILVFAGVWFAFPPFDRATDPLLTLRFVVFCILIAEAFLIRTFGVDLTPASANIRGFRRRHIPWQEVQAVLCHEQMGQLTVQLILENGKTAKLRAPTSIWVFNRAAYERDFHRIGQWWLAHRGESWRPVQPEAPRPADGLPDTR